MNSQKQKHLGRTDISVSSIGLGTAPLSSLYGSVPEAQAIETIQHSLDAGITYFDTAPAYGAGLAEKRLGAALAGVDRDRYVLSTKAGVLPTDWESEGEFDFSRDSILRSVEESLERLNVDLVDILLIHDPDRHYRQALDEAYPAMVELKDQGIVKAIGVGINQWQMLMDFANEVDFDCFMLANQYTLLVQDGLPLMDLCAERGIGILSAGIYNSGILATGPVPGAKFLYSEAPPEIMERTRRIEAICERYDVPLNVAALQFPMAHPATTCVVVGTSSATRLAGYLEAMQMTIPAELWADLQQEGFLQTGVPLPKP